MQTRPYRLGVRRLVLRRAGSACIITDDNVSCRETSRFMPTRQGEVGMSDLEGFLAQEGREEQIAEVRQRIDADGVTYIYYQFASVTGRVMGKGVPSPHWEAIARRGFQLVYGSTANLFTDRHGNYIGYGPEAWELVGIPDVETFCQLPWDPKTARVFCTLFRNREEETDPGGYLTSDCRG